LSACVENSGELGWVVGCSLGGERWDGKEEEGETEEESVGSGGVYNGFYRWNHQQNVSVGDSIGDSVSDSAMSLYGYLSLNPTVIPSVKSSEKIVCRRYGWYIPTEYFHRYILTVSPTDVFRRYKPTDFETEFSPSVITTDRIFLSVIPLVFSGFLVVPCIYQNSIPLLNILRYHRSFTNIPPHLLTLKEISHYITPIRIILPIQPHTHKLKRIISFSSYNQQSQRTRMQKQQKTKYQIAETEQKLQKLNKYLLDEIPK
jgi:hypothetical protein